MPAPWIASEAGWIVAEYGRQPWVVEGILPTFLGVSSLPASHLWLSLFGFIGLYSALLVLDIVLMVKYIKKGPELAMAHGPIKKKSQNEAQETTS